MHDLGPEADGDGRRLQWHSSGALVTAANSPIIGGGIIVAPKASLTDGYLDLVLIGDVGKSGVAVLFPEMMAGGKHANSKDVRIIRCRAVTINPGQGAVHLPAAYADGEFLGTLPLHAELRPGAIKVLVAPH
jgi:diacylglycerol kinase (ATP)